MHAGNWAETAIVRAAITTKFFILIVGWYSLGGGYRRVMLTVGMRTIGWNAIEERTRDCFDHVLNVCCRRKEEVGVGQEAGV